MHKRPLTDAFSLAAASMKDNLAMLLLAGMAYASMNLVIQLPAFLMDVAGIFDKLFKAGIPIGGIQSLSGEQQAATVLQTGIVVLSGIVNSILWMGGLQLGLAMVDGKAVDIWDGVLEIGLVPAAVLIGFVGFLVTPFYMCCLLPGVIVSAILYHWPTALVDRPGSLMEAFSAGVDLFRADLLAHTVIVSLLSLALLLGSLALYVPSVVLFPYTFLVAAHMYRLRVPAQREE